MDHGSDGLPYLCSTMLVTSEYRSSVSGRSQQADSCVCLASSLISSPSISNRHARTGGNLAHGQSMLTRSGILVWRTCFHVRWLRNTHSDCCGTACGSCGCELKQYLDCAGCCRYCTPE